MKFCTRLPLQAASRQITCALQFCYWKVYQQGLPAASVQKKTAEHGSHGCSNVHGFRRFCLRLAALCTCSILFSCFLGEILGHGLLLHQGAWEFSLQILPVAKRTPKTRGDSIAVR